MLNMQTQQYKHRYYYLPNGTTSLASEVLTPFFLPYFYNYFHCLYYIMLGYFNVFLPVASNLNGPTNLFYARDMSLWYYTYFYTYIRNRLP